MPLNVIKYTHHVIFYACNFKIFRPGNACKRQHQQLGVKIRIKDSEDIFKEHNLRGLRCPQ
jgi:hypothetical protein